MRRMFLVGILAIVAMMGNVTAQAVPNSDTAVVLNAYGPLGEAPKECSGSWSGPTPSSCEFICSPGDYLYVWGSTVGDRFGYPVGVTVSASCGDVNVQCTCLRRGTPFSGTPPCTCEATSEDAVLDEEASGSCSARRATGSAVRGEYYCSSFAPEEAAEWEASGEGWVIQIPEP
jgi:hypothetical protein